MKKQDGLRTQSEFYRRLQSGQIERLYLLEGEEKYQRAQALARLAATAIDQSVRDFNYSTISVAQGNLDQALAMARQFPMISPRRMVVVTGFEAISDDAQLELLKDYLRAPVESTVLVFVSDGLDNRRNIAAMLHKGCEVIRFDRLDDQQTIQWVRDYFARENCMIDASAAAYLVGMVGVDLLKLSNEIDKLITYAGGESGRKFVTEAEIDLLVRNSREHSNFELTDAILDGDRKRALRLLDRIFANTSESQQSLSLMILGAIASNYRRLLAAKELIRQNAPNSEVARAVGMSPYAVTKFNERARRVETGRVVKAIERIAQTDVALKSSLATPRLQLELLICELCPRMK